tara:strand:- start:97601 stop:98224 length:624 start_codon:yes stop_codon:yes gene_type:complete
MSHNTIFIGIAGPTASGKTLLAKTIVEELGSDQVMIISEDSYYKDLVHLPIEERAKVNFDHPDAFDHDLLREQMEQLQQGKTVQVPLYDHSQHIRKAETCAVGNHTIVVIEGILLLSEPKIRELLDISLFMDTALDLCLLRRVSRDVKERARTLECVLKQYEQTVRPMYYQFIEPAKRHADIIVPHGGKNRIAIEVIKAKMRELLEG